MVRAERKSCVILYSYSPCVAWARGLLSTVKVTTTCRTTPRTTANNMLSLREMEGERERKREGGRGGKGKERARERAGFMAIISL